jgi:hypothetical protein
MIPILPVAFPGGNRVIALQLIVRLMNHILRRLGAAVIAVALISPVVAQASSPSHSLKEDAALELLQHTLKRDHVYEKRISWDCISYGTEGTTNAYFEFVLREIHNAKCGGPAEWESGNRSLPSLSAFRQDHAVGSS